MSLCSSFSCSSKFWPWPVGVSLRWSRYLLRASNPGVFNGSFAVYSLSTSGILSQKGHGLLGINSRPSTKGSARFLWRNPRRSPPVPRPLLATLSQNKAFVIVSRYVVMKYGMVTRRQGRVG